MEPLPKFRLYIFTRIIRLKVLIVCNKDKLFLFRITYYIDPHKYFGGTSIQRWLVSTKVVCHVAWAPIMSTSRARSLPIPANKNPTHQPKIATAIFAITTFYSLIRLLHFSSEKKL